MTERKKTRMLRRLIPLLLLLTLTGWPLAAQDDSPADPITLTEPELAEGVGLFDQPQWMAAGTLTVSETAGEAFTNPVVYATVYDADGEVVGEGFGGPVDACGLALRPDDALQPGEEVPYRVMLDLDADDITPASAEVEISSAEAVEATPVNPFLAYPNLTTLFRGEVVRLEWSPEGLLRFAVGCEQDIFTEHQWYEYDPVAGDTRPIDPPGGESIDAATLNRLDLDTPIAVEHAKIHFHPAERRLIYQDLINTIQTAEPDGTFQRLLWADAGRISLQGFNWLPEGRFVAYYYGAYGDEVRYFTASMAGQKISISPMEVVPSLIVPGSTPDGARVVIAVEQDGRTTYRLQSTSAPGRFDELFEGDAPGNNFPAPVYVQGATGVNIYLVRQSVLGDVRLQCFDVPSRTLNDLALLPLSLTPDERGLSALSPDRLTLALSAEGRRGGVWLIDLAALPCVPG